MFRMISVSLLAAALCFLQSGCCCCRLPAAMMGRPAPIVFNPPPIVFNPPPVVVAPPRDNNPFKDNNNPFKDNNNPFKDKAIGPPAAKIYVYNQTTGQLKLDNKLICTGYSGKGQARNNPAMQAVKDGPIPIGEYMITGKQDDPNLGGQNIGLLPVAGGNFFNRFPGERFAILPETNPPNNPPSGCFIVVPRNVLDTISTDPFTKVQVVK
jgi:hypothetical protein